MKIRNISGVGGGVDKFLGMRISFGSYPHKHELSTIDSQRSPHKLSGYEQE